MSVAISPADRQSRIERIHRAVALLEEALQIVDELGELPDAGARIDEVKSTLIEALTR